MRYLVDRQHPPSMTGTVEHDRDYIFDFRAIFISR